MKTIYDFKVADTKGSQVSLGDYKAKVLLVVNTATKCGLTPQYKALEEIYEKYHSRGFEILDFPCNQFLEQAPEDDAGIAQFCTLQYKTTFPRFKKIEVNGPGADPLFVWLKELFPQGQTTDKAREFEAMVKQYTPNAQPGDIKWNFGKFLVDKAGNPIARYSPAITPEELEGDIEKALSA
jgi:glutathione peroxidase